MDNLVEKLPWRIEYKGMPRFLRIGHSGGNSEWYIQYAQLLGIDGEEPEPFDVVTTGTLNEAAGMMLEKLEQQEAKKK